MTPQNQGLPSGTPGVPLYISVFLEGAPVYYFLQKILSLGDGKKSNVGSFQRISVKKMCQGCHFSRKNSLKLAYGSN